MPKIKGWKDPDYIKANIVSYMFLHNLETSSVAKAVGMSLDWFYKTLRNPKRFRLEQLEKMAKLFECKIEDIIYPKV